MAPRDRSAPQFEGWYRWESLPSQALRIAAALGTTATGYLTRYEPNPQTRYPTKHGTVLLTTRGPIFISDPFKRLGPDLVGVFMAEMRAKVTERSQTLTRLAQGGAQVIAPLQCTNGDFCIEVEWQSHPEGPAHQHMITAYPFVELVTTPLQSIDEEVYRAFLRDRDKSLPHFRELGIAVASMHAQDWPRRSDEDFYQSCAGNDMGLIGWNTPDLVNKAFEIETGRVDGKISRKTASSLNSFVNAVFAAPAKRWEHHDAFVHGDLTPGNAPEKRDGKVVLLDFETSGDTYLNDDVRRLEYICDRFNRCLNHWTVQFRTTTASYLQELARRGCEVDPLITGLQQIALSRAASATYNANPERVPEVRPEAGAHLHAAMNDLQFAVELEGLRQRGPLIPNQLPQVGESGVTFAPIATLTQA